MVFLKHHDGHIFPVAMNVHPVHDKIVGVYEKLPCDEEFIWFYADSLAICAASMESLAMLGVRGNFSNETSIAEFT